ncbi:efflux RND transporter periplasmic adaptor subunit [Telmatospirillum siberiense]|uniref:Efflux transporter periplasmic adaptor subunit n=1 Tax=Telmatospirillum siberiense TaxID=382514 RepID=A0A2N3PQJ2_9PROT|nr:efflux RND transporter periplasmic adaptor subunit [Telmatospirillum siberiense]PKU22673.1 efflux transporter periplasmic adaptor subunit [Telmatospirillum siberiense]
MSRKTSSAAIAIAGVAVIAALGGGYWLGRSQIVPLPSSAGGEHSAAAGHSSGEPEARSGQAHPHPQGETKSKTVLYYKDPMGKADFSPEPKKDATGMDYLPVYAEEEAAAAPAAVALPAPVQGKGKILFYRNPMGLPDTSPVPKKDPMGMDYVPVFEGDDDGGPIVKISVDKVQKLGVRTAAVERRQLTHTVRAVGTVQVDERLLRLVTPKFEGYVEALHVNTTGQLVRRGEPLMEIYSPDLVLAQEEYLAAAKSLESLDADASTEARASARLLVDGALQRLRNWDIPSGELARLKGRGIVSRTLALPSPADGVVLEKNVISGQRFMPGEVLYRIADLSNVWLIGEVYEQELSYIRVGQTARVTFNGMPGETFTGKLTFIYPTLSAETRTVKVRIELPNPGLRLKPALYGSVDIATAAADHAALAVPDSALLDSGTRKVVLVERGEGRYEPREVTTGARADGYVEIVDGLAAGETVVTSANFLIDAESNLRAALQSFHH